MVAPATSWMHATWAWLKVNWKWLLFPVGALLYFIGRAAARKEYVVVVSPELVAHQEVKGKLDAEADAKRQEADSKASGQLAGIEAERSAKAASETQKQMDAVDAVQGDPAAVSDFLKQVGQDVRRK